MSICKIILFITAIFLGIHICSAQEISIRGGFNLSQYRIMYDDLDGPGEGAKLNTGFNVGPMLELPILDIFSLETGILFTSKGHKGIVDVNGATVKEIENLYYLDLPVLFKITFPVKNVGIFAMAGPYIGEAMYGKYKNEVTYNSETDKFGRNIFWGGNKQYEYDRFDYGLKFGAGLRYLKLQFGALYEVGYKDFSNQKQPPSPVLRNNRVIEIYLSYALLNLKSHKK